ncbi:MAG: hypothetical protein WKF34_02510 [Pyrinomonadaceae bacterium]
MKIFANLAASALLIAGLASGIAGQSLKTDEIIAKHLGSIASPAKRGELKTLMAIGASEFEVKSPVVRGKGRAVMVSNPANLFFIISLNSKEYPFEKIGHFHGKSSLPFISAGNRSLLGAFLNEHDIVLSEGLFGGTMSLRWPLLLADKKAMIKSAGTKKVGERKSYVLDYMPRGVGSSDFTIRLFFDADNFNHLRTEYRRQVDAGRIIFGQQNQLSSSVITLTEDFSIYKVVDGVTLPHEYRIRFASNSSSVTSENIWGVQVLEYRLNQALQPDFFTFETNN